MSLDFAPNVALYHTAHFTHISLAVNDLHFIYATRAIPRPRIFLVSSELTNYARGPSAALEKMSLDTTDRETADRLHNQSVALTLSSFELLLTCNPPVLESLLLQLPTSAVLSLFHTSPYLRQFLHSYPTAWKYLSFRLFQPAQITTVPAATNPNGPRQSSSYALDQLLMHIVNPFSTCLTSLDLDNTAVSGQNLAQTVLYMKRETLKHLSVRGCKNVSLKYHINPFLMLFRLVNDVPGRRHAPPDFQKLALTSLYTYRCRHHRRRPYLPSSLLRKDSDSEPTHELVELCHQLGIWTDTAWCTTPGARCYRRRGYVSMRVSQEPREVWVVYDRLWRSRNWLGALEKGKQPGAPEVSSRKRKRDCRSWEFGEDAAFGEPLGTKQEGKTLPVHLRKSHYQFVQDVKCDNCAAEILERCEQCSVMMHCSGCRKTLCASCAYDKPYLRTRNTTDEERAKLWWAPGCPVSPCSMHDQDPPGGPGVNPPPPAGSSTAIPNLTFKWCCTEPLFSGGGGITFGPGALHDHDQIRASPLPKLAGWEDPEFFQENFQSPAARDRSSGSDRPSSILGPGGRWSSIDSLFRRDDMLHDAQITSHVPRNLCGECYSSEQWKIRCKACALPLCLRHDLRDSMRLRICGYKDLPAEKRDFRLRLKASKAAITVTIRQKVEITRNDEIEDDHSPAETGGIVQQNASVDLFTEPDGPQSGSIVETGDPASNSFTPTSLLQTHTSTSAHVIPVRESDSDDEEVLPASSNGTAAPSRSSSPTPSTGSDNSTRTPHSRDAHNGSAKGTSPGWHGCQAFLCPQSRPPGDHRRRCPAVMRQCLECTINVCADCVRIMEPSCPCASCRVVENTNSTAVVDPSHFYCPNCRWERRRNGKCKLRLTLADDSDPGKGGRRAKKKQKKKLRKPVEDRKASTAPRRGLDGVGEFFDGIESNMAVLAAGSGTDDDQVATPGQPAVHLEQQDGQQQREQQDAEEDENHDDFVENPQAFEDMSVLARDLISRIRRLRAQFRPASTAIIRPIVETALGDDRAASSALVVLSPGTTTAAAITAEVDTQPIVDDMD